MFIVAINCITLTILQKRLVFILSLLDASNVAALKHSSSAQKWSVRNMAAVIMFSC